MIATNPPTDVRVPSALRRLAGGHPTRPVWRNVVGGLTFEVDGHAERYFVKWTPAASGIDLGGEVDRLAWATRFTPVPIVLDHGSDVRHRGW